MEDIIMGSWKRYVAALILNVVLTLTVLFVRGFELKIYYVDAFSVAGAVSILLGLLFWVAAAGAFDAIGYGFSTLRAERRRDKDLYEYSVRKKEKRSRKKGAFLPYMIVGAVFAAVSILLSIT
ncbi:MAG: DUF3899 domain-containing protein [Lachnospiraceae bacterium]|nr:DUF3899 domain-containing protein [Lachnospiraceae bacterium]